MSQGGVSSPGVVEALDVLEDRTSRYLPSRPRVAVDQLADLSGANLSETKLLRANRCDVEAIEERVGPIDELLKMDLSRANLREAILTEAVLTGANLQGAKVSDEQLADTLCLQGATMPNGQQYEDWIKDRQKHQQDE